MSTTHIIANGRAFAYAQQIGLFFVLLLGVTAAAALVIGAIWLTAQLLFLVYASLIEVLGQVGDTWRHADSLTRLLLLVFFLLAGYWITRKVCRHA